MLLCFFGDELSLLITYCFIQTYFTIPQKLCASAEFSQRHHVGLALKAFQQELISHMLPPSRRKEGHVLAAAGRFSDF